MRQFIRDVFVCATVTSFGLSGAALASATPASAANTVTLTHIAMVNTTVGWERPQPKS